MLIVVDKNCDEWQLKIFNLSLTHTFEMHNTNTGKVHIKKSDIPTCISYAHKIQTMHINHTYMHEHTIRPIFSSLHIKV